MKLKLTFCWIFIGCTAKRQKFEPGLCISSVEHKLKMLLDRSVKFRLKRQDVTGSIFKPNYFWTRVWFFLANMGLGPIPISFLMTEVDFHQAGRCILWSCFYQEKTNVKSDCFLVNNVSFFLRIDFYSPGLFSDLFPSKLTQKQAPLLKQPPPPTQNKIPKSFPPISYSMENTHSWQHFRHFHTKTCSVGLFLWSMLPKWQWSANGHWATQQAQQKMPWL